MSPRAWAHAILADHYARQHSEGVLVLFSELPVRVAAAAIVAHPRSVWRLARDRIALWTALPGDRFVWFVGNLTLEVVAVPRPGRPVLRDVANARGAPLPPYGIRPLRHVSRLPVWNHLRPWDLERQRDRKP